MADLNLQRAGRTRLAPTPSGYLHTGNAINFLVTHLLAKEFGWKVLLRIDDLDAERVRPKYVEDIFRSLEWLGIGWDEGPSGPDDFRAKWSQHLRMERYHAIANALREGGHVYGCTCTRSTLRETANDGRYPGTCRAANHALDDPECVWRLHVPEATMITIPGFGQADVAVDLAALMGDLVIRQRQIGTAQGRPAYQLASLADDVDFGVAHIVRGADLLPSTACQLYIAKLLGMMEFEATRFLHHPLELDAEGQKLSKSEGASSLKAMRVSGGSAVLLQRRAESIVAKLLNP